MKKIVKFFKRHYLDLSPEGILFTWAVNTILIVVITFIGAFIELSA